MHITLNISPDVFKTFINSHSLEELELTDVKFSSSKFDIIAKACPNLKSLSLNASVDSSTLLNESSFIELKSLSLSAADVTLSISTLNLAMQILTHNCKQLRSLTLKNLE